MEPKLRDRMEHFDGEWVFAISNKESTTDGQHWTLCVEKDKEKIKKENLSQDDILELMDLALKFAELKAPDSKYRIAVNGHALSSDRNKHFHIHIILPKGKDKLPRLVAKVRSELIIMMEE